MRKIIMVFMMGVLFASAVTAQVTSALWGVDGDAWNTNGILRDFTHAGYKGGAVPIPGTNDWPNAVSVLDYGAIPDDFIHDSDAFIAAISNCPDYSAIFVPKGRYLITKKIVSQRNHFVLRGEDMYETILFYPKYLSEAYIEEVGFVDDGGTTRNTTDGWFIDFTGGEENSIENLTLEFREQRKISPWEYIGANFLTIGGSNCWVRNIYMKNYDSGIQVNGKNHSILNIVMDQFNGRQAVDDDLSGKLDAYSGILPRNLSYCLFHNIDITGHVLQPIDNNESISWSVYSKCRTGEGNNRVVGLHGGSTHNHLYTELNRPVSRHDDTGDPLYGNFFDCTYWNINASLSSDAYTAADNQSIYVGHGDDWAFKSNSTFYYEPAAYGALIPTNLYLAQLEYFGKPLPEDFVNPPLEAYERSGDVFRVVPDDDVTPDEAFDGMLKIKNGAYFKFDLSQANEANVAKARLRFTFKSIVNAPFRVAAYSVSDDTWVETNLTTSNKPAVGSELDSEWIYSDRSNLVVELDVTSFVESELVGGDGVISLYANFPEGNGFLSTAWCAEAGQKPELIVERIADPVPGVPSAPKGIRSTPLVGNIVLDWDDNPESDIATYNVYRTPSADGWIPQSGGLVTSDHVDVSSTDDWHCGMMDYRQVYHYWITAVDEHGYESEKSRTFVAAVVHPYNDPPAFATGPLGLPDATTGDAYSADVAPDAGDPESDQLYFMKVSGPDWLDVALDGTLSGTPATGEEGTYQVMVQVTAIGGSDEATYSLTVVTGSSNNPPTANAGSDQMVTDSDDNGSESVTLDGSGSTDADGTIVSYVWTEGTTQIATGVNPSVDLPAGSHTITLTVTDDDSAIDTDTVDITVNAAGVTPPVGEVVAYYPFNASSLASVDSDTNSVAGDMVVGAGVTTFYWETREFWSPTQPSAAFNAGTDFVDGTVLDDDCFSFTITPETGMMMDLTSLSFIDRSGGFSVSAASDLDGFLTVIDSVPAAGSWATNTLDLSSLSGITDAVEIRLYFHNGIGDSRMIDNVEIKANVGPEPPPNEAPTADAGDNQMVTDMDDNGSESITLDGSGSSDPDGSIVSYIWKEGTTQIATGVNPSVNLAVGSHTINLTVTDDEGAADTNTVTITVNAAPVIGVIGYYPFDARSQASTDTDTNSVAGELVVGAGVTTFHWETRDFWSPTQPSAAFHAGTDFVDGTVLDDDYFSFTITPEAGVALDLVSLSFIDRSGGFSVSVATDQDGFATVIDSVAAAGSWAVNTLDLSSLSGITGATELRLYFHNGSSADRMIDNVTISANVGSGTPPDDTTPPAVPTGLSALAGIGEVDLDWADNTEGDLDSYTVYRSTTSGSGYAAISTVGTSDYLDSDVTDHTVYYYKVTATDTNSNESAQSAYESAQPGWVANLAASDVAVQGTVSGTMADMDMSDDVYQMITEVVSGNTSALEHKWTFNLTAAELITVYLEAHHSANSEGDKFVFAYSTDDVNYSDIITVTKTADDDTVQWAALPGSPSGTLYIRVLDADRSDNNTQLDTISIDNLFIVSEESSTAPTAATTPAPVDSATDVAASTDLSWTAGMMASSHDVYFGTSPSPAFQGNQTGTTFDPGTLANDTVYYWAVDEVNNSGTTAGSVWSFTTVALPNVAPTAHAGSDQTVTDTDDSGAENVTLNGSGSSDSDGAIASYVWEENSTQIATGVNPSVLLGVGTHTITLTVTDDDGATDTDTVVVTVEAAPVVDSMHVDSIALTAVQAGGPNRQGLATVVIVDQNSQPVQNVTVTGSFSGDINESVSGTTDSSGQVALQSTVKAKAAVSLTFTVDNVTHASYTYDSASNVETSESGTFN